MNGTYEKWFAAVECSSIYPANITATNARLEIELDPLYGESVWFCPNISNIILQNDPFTYTFGHNLNFVLNYCDVSAERKGIVDPNCETNHTVVMEYLN